MSRIPDYFQPRQQIESVYYIEEILSPRTVELLQAAKCLYLSPIPTNPPVTRPIRVNDVPDLNRPFDKSVLILEHDRVSLLLSVSHIDVRDNRLRYNSII